MDPNAPLLLVVFFVATVVITLFFLAKATRSRTVWIASTLWLLFQSAVSLTGFYTVTNVLPPRLLLALGPPLVVIVLLLILPAGKRLIDAMDLQWTILLHTVRILVEITLFELFLYKQIPALMTFEGGNLDILSGLTAPLMWWAYRKGIAGKKLLLVWNILCLVGVLNAVVRALLSAPFPLQKIAFAQPNVAVLYFPFLLLPAFVVPAVLFCHMAIFRRLATNSI